MCGLRSQSGWAKKKLRLVTLRRVSLGEMHMSIDKCRLVCARVSESDTTSKQCRQIYTIVNRAVSSDWHLGSTPCTHAQIFARSHHRGWGLGREPWGTGARRRAREHGDGGTNTPASAGAAYDCPSTWYLVSRARMCRFLQCLALVQ
jgi:hypothetical protein